MEDLLFAMGDLSEEIWGQVQKKKVYGEKSGHNFNVRGRGY
jgi:hypothetical protein